MEIGSKDYIDVHKIEDNNTWRTKIYDWLEALQANTLLTCRVCTSHKQMKIFNSEGSQIYSVFGFGGSRCSCYRFKYYFSLGDTEAKESLYLKGYILKTGYNEA